MSQNFDYDECQFPRKKRRPALACERCRRRKIKCDRQTPCRPCTKANINSCTYVYDSRRTVNMEAPFEAHDTQFSVFDQTMRRATTTATSNIAPTTTSANNGMFEPVDVQFPQFTMDGDGSDASSIVKLAEQHCLWPASSNAVPATRQFITDPLQLGSLQDSLTGPTCSLFEYLRSAPTEWLRGSYFKTRFIGQSHWMNFVNKSCSALSVMQTYDNENDKLECATFAKCKAIGRTIKKQESIAVQMLGSPKDMVPSREVADRLVQAYMRTFQTVCSILHVNSFRKDYVSFWNDRESADDTFCVMLLLVMCVGSTFRPDSGVSRVMILQWIFVVSAWLSSRKDKAKLNLDGVRIECLFSLARQANSLGGNTTWLSTFGLVRMAMHIGLHIDPSHSSPYMSPVEAESRRRLWATILELEVQSSMDSGGIPSINSEDYDCALPSDIDDTVLEESGSSPSGTNAAMPENHCTQSSLQILLMRTMPVRLKIARAINNFRTELTFELALALSAELCEVVKSCATLIQTYRMGNTPPTTFQTKVFDLFVQRFLLGLHHPFAVKALSNPLYHYSRHICLETSLTLFSNLSQSNDDDFYRLCINGAGLFHDTYTQSALYMCGELTDPFKSNAPVTPSSVFFRDELHKATEKYLELAIARIQTVDRNVTRYVFFSCLLAQSDAMQSEAVVEQRILATLKKSLEMCCSLLRSQVHQDLPMPSLAEGSHVILNGHSTSASDDNQIQQQQEQQQQQQPPPPQRTQQMSWSPWEDLLVMSESELSLPQSAQSAAGEALSLGGMLENSPCHAYGRPQSRRGLGLRATQ